MLVAIPIFLYPLPPALTDEIRPYSDDSPWNTPIPPNPAIDPDNDIFLTAFGGQPLTSDPTQYTFPVFVVDDSTPVRTVYLSGWYSDVTNVGQDIRKQKAGTVEVPIPDGAQVSPGSDAQLILWNTQTGDEWAFYQAGPNPNGSWFATNGYHYNTHWNGVPPDRFGSRGAGVPYFAGLVRPWEIDTGRIGHALAFAYDYPTSEFVYPATKSDGLGTFPPHMPEGARLQLDPSLGEADFDAWGLSPEAKVIARALQEYGMIVIDNSGRPKVMMESEVTAKWDGRIVASTVSGIPLEDMRVLDLSSPIGLSGVSPMPSPPVDPGRQDGYVVPTVLWTPERRLRAI